MANELTLDVPIIILVTGILLIGWWAAAGQALAYKRRIKELQRELRCLKNEKEIQDMRILDMIKVVEVE